MDENQLLEMLRKFICHDIAAPLANSKSYFYLLKKPELSETEKDLILSRLEETNLLALGMIQEMRQFLKTHSP
jgi:hypothetical protein